MPLNLGGLIGGFTGRAGDTLLGFGVGTAIRDALAPEAERLAQESWSLDPTKVPDAGVLAAGVSQGQVDRATAHEWAAKHGFGTEAFDALVAIANTGPSIGLAFEAWRRGLLSPADFTRALKRTGLEDEWTTAIRGLHDALLDPSAIATAIHRGIIPAQGLLVREPPIGGGHVPSVPQSSIDGTREAAGHGVDAERLRVLVGNTGLPLAMGEMLQLLNRGEVTEDDVRRAVAQSNTRNEYMDVALALRRQLPTARDYIENALRGYRTLGDAIHGAALHGMTSDDATMIYQNQGRPLAIRQITTALARGGKFKPEPGEIDDPYRASVVEGNLKPAYYELAIANRYTLPGTFAIRQLAQSHTITQARAEELLRQSGWEPELAALVADAWSGGTATKAEPHVTKAQTSLFTALHKAYVNSDADDAVAREKMDVLEVPTDAQAEVLNLWNHERDLVRKNLTPTQIKKAYTEALFTHDDAIARLERLGYAPADAETFLTE